MKKLVLLLFLCLIFSSGFSQVANYNLGEKHNQVVEFLNNYDFSGKDENAFMDDLIYHTGKLFSPTAFPEGKKGIWGVIQFCGKADPGPLDNKTYAELIDLHAMKENLSASSVSILKDLESELDKSESYEEYLAIHQSLSSSLNLSALPVLEKEIVKGLFEVSKSSADYWQTYAQSQSAEKRWNWRCILCVAWNDVKGAAIGFAIGACICAKLGIPQPQVCGAVGAAIFGGLYSWAAKVCPKRCSRCSKPNPSTYPAWLCNILLF